MMSVQSAMLLGPVLAPTTFADAADRRVDLVVEGCGVDVDDAAQELPGQLEGLVGVAGQDAGSQPVVRAHGTQRAPRLFRECAFREHSSRRGPSRWNGEA